MSSSGLVDPAHETEQETMHHPPEICALPHPSPEDVEFLRKFRLAFDSMMAAAPGGGSHQFPDQTRNANANNDKGHGILFIQREPLTKANRASSVQAYKEKSDELKLELQDLARHFDHIGGEHILTIIQALNSSVVRVAEFDDALTALTEETEESTFYAIRRLSDLQFTCVELNKNLNAQKHAFSFRRLHRMAQTCVKILEEISTGLFTFLERALANLLLVEDAETNVEAKLDTLYRNVPKLTKACADVNKEFQKFSEQGECTGAGPLSALPSFAAEEEERATTRYLTLTTIATFFSSITATTLQFSYQNAVGGLNNAVNLLWFLSLIFSVSSGVNGLLSMMWRKSPVYANYKPPRYIELWLTKSPIVFLAISAFTFIVGLNLFPYSSLQPIYVSTLTNAFTALHILGLMIVATWYFISSKWTTYFLQSIRRNLLWALLREDRVVHVNEMIGDIADWKADPSSRPNVIAKATRAFLTLISLPFRESKRVLVFTFCWVKRTLRPLVEIVGRAVRNKAPRQGVKNSMSVITRGLKRREVAQSPPEDLEVGKDHALDGTVGAKPSLRKPEDVDRVVEEFRLAVAKRFKTSTIVEDFDYCVQRWKGKSFPAFGLDIRMKYLLWGYPGLLRLFTESVLPVLQAMEHEGLQYLLEDQAKALSAMPHSALNGSLTDADVYPVVPPLLVVDASDTGGGGDAPSTPRVYPTTETQPANEDDHHRDSGPQGSAARDDERRSAPLEFTSNGSDSGAFADAEGERAPNHGFNSAPDSMRGLCHED